MLSEPGHVWGLNACIGREVAKILLNNNSPMCAERGQQQPHRWSHTIYDTVATRTRLSHVVGQVFWVAIQLPYGKLRVLRRQDHGLSAEKNVRQR